MSSTPGTKKMSDVPERLLHLLEERVRQRKRVEIVEYVDELVPEFTVPVTNEVQVDDKMTYRLPELLGHYDEDFVRNIYQCILKRDVDFTGLQTGIEALQVERCSRVQLLGRLRYSDEGNRHGVYVRGLRRAYFLARLRKVPVVGALVSSITNLRTLWALPSEMQWIDTQLSENEEQLAMTQGRVSDHFSLTIDRLGNSSLSDDAEQTGVPASDVSDGPIALTQLLRLSGERFVEWSYDCVMSRSPTATEKAEAIELLSAGAISKITFLGKLARAANKPMDELKVIGFQSAYRLDYMERVPVFGFFFKLSRCVALLLRLDTILEYQAAQVSRSSGQIVAIESHLMSHYNGTVRQLKREVVDALRSQGD